MPFIIDGPALKRMRQRRRLTLVGLAKKSGVSRRAIGYSENTTAHVPDPLTIDKLAKALKVPAADFTVWVE